MCREAVLPAVQEQNEQRLMHIEFLVKVRLYSAHSATMERDGEPAVIHLYPFNDK